MWLYIQMAYTLCVLYLFSIQDIKTRIVPLKWVILSLFGSLVLRFLYSPNPFSEYIISSLSIGIFLWILSILSNRGMGGGDIQLVAWLGLTVGFFETTFVLIVSNLLVLCYRIVKKNLDYIAFVPYLCAGELVLVYLRIFSQ
ncbi:prepilin peptidase [Paenibacillus farraposensis]|uniref:Prepilin peptidase n=1 Tax=Paenibacillus farraposensis TaxID=2807095 RepID=A0ABW4DHR6_9BACL